MTTMEVGTLGTCIPRSLERVSLARAIFGTFRQGVESTEGHLGLMCILNQLYKRILGSTVRLLLFF